MPLPDTVSSTPGASDMDYMKKELQNERPPANIMEEITKDAI